MITLIGMGSGTPESLTAQGLAALQNAGLILGAKRLLEQLPQGCTEHRKALYQPEDVLAALAADPEILILDDDHIAGRGTHEELLANNAIYQEIYQSQQEGVGE